MNIQWMFMLQWTFSEHNPTIELPELTPDWEIDSWRAQQNLVSQDAEKGAATPQETVPDLPVGVQESPAEAWVGGDLMQGRGTESSSTWTESFEGGHHYLHYLHHSLASDK